MSTNDERRSPATSAKGVQADSAVSPFGSGRSSPPGDLNCVEDADALQIGHAGQPISRRNDPRVHPQETFDHTVAAGLFRHLTDHRVERILTLLDPSSRKSPSLVTIRRDGKGEQYLSILDAHGISSQPQTHLLTLLRGEGPRSAFRHSTGSADAQVA